jgi:hypothetical protein
VGFHKFPFSEQKDASIRMTRGLMRLKTTDPIHMSGMSRYCDVSARWECYSIRKGEILYNPPNYRTCKRVERAISINYRSFMEVWDNLNLPAPIPKRWDSLAKLSTLRIFPMETLVQPSALIISSTSLRIGATYSG